MTPKKTALYDCHIKQGCQLVEFANTMLPVRYSSEKEEHLAVRHSVGMFDISHMGEFLVEGADAGAFLQAMLSNDIDKLSDNEAQYTLMLNEEGGIIDDLIVYRLAKTRYLLIVNAATIDKDFTHLQNYQASYPQRSLTNVSDKYSLIAVQGPASAALIKSLSPDELPKRFAISTIMLCHQQIMLARTGYTGEDGFEILLEKNQAQSLWECLHEQGRAYGLKLCGLSARDTLRLEAGLLLNGQDMDESISPLEARLMFAVAMHKPTFIGKSALVQQQQQGVPKKLMPFMLLERGIPRHGFKVFDDNNHEIGVVTSGSMPPQNSHGIGLAYIKTSLAQFGQEIYIDIRGRLARAKIVRWRPSY